MKIGENDTQAIRDLTTVRSGPNSDTRRAPEATEGQEEPRASKRILCTVRSTRPCRSNQRIQRISD